MRSPAPIRLSAARGVVRLKRALLALACCGATILVPMPALLLGGTRGWIASLLIALVVVAGGGAILAGYGRVLRLTGAAVTVDANGVSDARRGSDTIPWARIREIDIRRDDDGDVLWVFLQPARDAAPGASDRFNRAIGAPDAVIALDDLQYDRRAMAQQLVAFQQWAEATRASHSTEARDGV
jgi:hypothetical protein